MKLKDYLKKFQGLDPETDVDEFGRILPKIEIAYQEGYNASGLDKNPYDSGSLESICFIGGYKDKLNHLDDQILDPDH